MLSAKISAKGQVVIPKQYREMLDIKPGTYFHVRIEKNAIVFTPAPESPLERLYNRFAGEIALTDLEKEHADEISSMGLS